jgi:hypothetical protein
VRFSFRLCKSVCYVLTSSTMVVAFADGNVSCIPPHGHVVLWERWKRRASSNVLTRRTVRLHVVQVSKYVLSMYCVSFPYVYMKVRTCARWMVWRAFRVYYFAHAFHIAPTFYPAQAIATF